MSEASITVIVQEMEEDPSPLSFNSRPFLAHVAANPDIKADGHTEEDAILRLKYLLLHRYGTSKRKVVREISLDELLVEEVMNG